jgi:uncharacterized membrane protein YjgN (DUF898 family)
MQPPKLLDFKANAGDYFILTILSMVLAYVPFFGWAFLFNYTAGWFAERTLVNGRKAVYRASYMETLKLVTVGSLLTVVTLGIYTFWFAPKMYRFVAEHVQYDDAQASASGLVSGAESTPMPVATDAPVVPVQPPADPTQPPASTPPVAG